MGRGGQLAAAARAEGAERRQWSANGSCPPSLPPSPRLRFVHPALNSRGSPGRSNRGVQGWPSPRQPTLRITWRQGRPEPRSSRHREAQATRYGAPCSAVGSRSSWRMVAGHSLCCGGTAASWRWRCAPTTSASGARTRVSRRSTGPRVRAGPATAPNVARISRMARGATRAQRRRVRGD